MKFNFKNKETNKESFEKKYCVATLWEMTRTHERKNSFFKEPETIFPWGKKQLLAQALN